MHPNFPEVPIWLSSNSSSYCLGFAHACVRGRSCLQLMLSLCDSICVAAVGWCQQSHDDKMKIVCCCQCQCWGLCLCIVSLFRQGYCDLQAHSFVVLYRELGEARCRCAAAACACAHCCFSRCANSVTVSSLQALATALLAPFPGDAGWSGIHSWDLAS